MFKVFKIAFIKSDSINYNSALDVVDILFIFIVELKRLAIVLFVVDSLYKKIIAVLNKVVFSPI